MTGFTSQYDLGLIFSNAFHLLKEGWTRYAAVFLLIQMPLVIIQLAAFPSGSSSLQTDPEMLLRLMLTAVFFGFLGLIVTLNVNSIAVDQITNAARPFHQRFAYSVTKFPVAVFAAVVYGVVVFTGLLALIIPGIIFGIYGSLFLQIIVLREKGIIGSLVHSYELIKGNWWRVFGTQLLLVVSGLVIALPFMILDLVFSFGFAFNVVENTVLGCIALFASLVNVMIMLNLEAIKTPAIHAPDNIGL